MGCWYTPRLNHLWSIWYCIIVCSLQAYLLFLGIVRYRQYTEHNWGPGGYPHTELSIYIIIHAIVIALCPFFIAFSVFKTGNLASDNEQIGARPNKTIQTYGSCCWRVCKGAWLHSPPSASTVHLMMATGLLIAQQIMIAQLYKWGFLRHEELWSTDLDFIHRGGSRLLHLLPMNASMMGEARRARLAWPVPPKVLTIALSMRMYGISLELINFVLALLFYAITYPAVFWRVSKCFSLLFSLNLLVHGVTAVLAYISFTLLYRINIYGVYRALGGTIDAPLLLRNSYVLLTVYLVSAAVLYMSSTVVYGYGYNKYCISWLTQRSRMAGCAMNSSLIGRKGILRHGTSNKQVCCEGYSPHIASLLLLVCMVASKAPLVYDLMILYQYHRDGLMLVCIVADVTFMFCWILLWLGLTLKRDWNMTVEYSLQELVNLLQPDWKPTLPTNCDGPSQIQEPDNVIIIVSNGEVFVSDDANKKAAIIRQAQKYEVGFGKEDVYWVKPNIGNSTGASPAINRRRTSETEKQSPETSNLLQRPSVAHTPPTRRTYDDSDIGGPAATKIVRSPVRQQVSQSYMRFNESSDNSPYDEHAHDVVTTFGTMPRTEYKKKRLIQGSDADFYASAYGGSARPSQERDPSGAAYASIHKSSRPSPVPTSLISSSRGGSSGPTDNYARYNPAPSSLGDNDSVASRGSSYVNLPSSSRRGMNDNVYAHTMQHGYRGPPQARVINPAMSSYSTTNAYSRTPNQPPQQSRGGGGGGQYATMNGSHYGNQPHYSSSPVYYNRADAGRVRQSPKIERHQGLPPTDPNRTVMTNGGGQHIMYASHDQAMNATTSGSREITPTNGYGNRGVHWQSDNGQQRTSSLETASDNPSITPNSTLTSQGSYTLRGPPSVSSPPPVDEYATLTPSGSLPPTGYQPPVRSAASNSGPSSKTLSPNVLVDCNDSANFSLTSSNDSADHSGVQFSTSVV